MRENAWGVAQRMNPLTCQDATIVNYHSCMKPLKGGILFCGQDHIFIKGIKGRISLLFCHLALLIFYFRSFHGMMRTDRAVVGSSIYIYIIYWGGGLCSVVGRSKGSVSRAVN